MKGNTGGVWEGDEEEPLSRVFYCFQSCGPKTLLLCI